MARRRIVMLYKGKVYTMPTRAQPVRRAAASERAASRQMQAMDETGMGAVPALADMLRAYRNRRGIR